ncbi:hypothetical protein K431DRAFT_35360 [Polychaeton citri CBS 116435]|uniref:Uncharacterized protein n=1 Tax=Polychaeton citri CBS 116435 TaxID=1314669 RepID=A0A9P4Q0S1_9PEZI|nr:hypothetical protein K431DRAFT_35360 [Polychaeton citri CBS 116435]
MREEVDLREEEITANGNLAHTGTSPTKDHQHTSGFTAVNGDANRPKAPPQENGRSHQPPRPTIDIAIATADREHHVPLDRASGWRPDTRVDANAHARPLSPDLMAFTKRKFDDLDRGRDVNARPEPPIGAGDRSPKRRSIFPDSGIEMTSPEAVNGRLSVQRSDRSPPEAPPGAAYVR